jgi:transglutaminase-like putative cysteine protease
MHTRRAIYTDQHPIPLVDAMGKSGVFFFTAPRSNLAALVTPAHPVWTSRPSILSFTPTIENQIDPLMFHADPPILIGEEYSVHANVFNPTASQLLAAGTTYPDWAGALPADPGELAPQLTDLARQITAEAATPYDKAVAVTSYLRTSISYSITIPAPPPDMDPLAWFLFDLKKGFCTYYATAEVLLLRSVGVPARLVAGFAQGQFEAPDKFNVLGDTCSGSLLSRPAAEFEPTSSQPPCLPQR